jgi:hypothetical protein
MTEADKVGEERLRSWIFPLALQLYAAQSGMHREIAAVERAYMNSGNKAKLTRVIVTGKMTHNTVSLGDKSWKH